MFQLKPWKGQMKLGVPVEVAESAAAMAADVVVRLDALGGAHDDDPVLPIS